LRPAVVLDGRDAVGRRVLLLGAGGAGTSIAFSLLAADARTLAIYDIDGSKAARFSERVRARRSNSDVRATMDSSSRGFDLIVNASSAGLHPDTDRLPVPVEFLEPNMLAADIVMDPTVTPLLAAAKACGCDVRYGAGMLDRPLELVMKFFGLA
jgi:shikimate dehydrogenase